ncbi:MAG: serine/threonine-protein kinase [Myxococcota bacterium]
MTESSPAQVGPYVPQQLLAMGAQSSVWLGTGPRGPVILKIARSEGSRRSLVREGRVLRATEHPNLVKLLDSDPNGEWLALERIDGAHVDQWAQNRPIDDVLKVAVQLVGVLDHLHQHGVIHGDVKPSNVIVSAKGVAKLIDLGVTSAPGERVEGFRGTLGYAAPELLSGRPVSPATDLYGLGALLYTTLAGRTPFVAPDPAALTYLPLVSLPAPPAAFRPEIPAPLNQLVLQLLSRDPDRRAGGRSSDAGRSGDAGRLRDALEKCRGALPGPPVLGMLDEREELRRAVVGAADGEARVVVLYGVPGTGRRTLIAEAVEYGRREGLPYLKGTDPLAALAALREAGRPGVLVMKAAHRGARQLAETVLKDSVHCLLLLHSDRPVPGLSALGAIQLTPAPLSAADAVRLAKVWNADLDQAEIWWRQSMGLPIAILARIRAWRRARGLTQTQHASLPSESRRIYEALRAKPKMKCHLLELASDLQMTEHTVLDHCEVLFAEELIESAEDGLALVVIRSRTAT